MKHVYQIITFIFVFGLSIFFFKNYIREVSVAYDDAVTMKSAEFPIISISKGDWKLNEIHGYSSSLAPCLVRESTALLDDSGKIKFSIDDAENEIKKLTYEIVRVSSAESVETDTINVLEHNKKGKYITIKIKTAMEQGKEYAMRLTCVTATGRKIYYYVRLKYYGEDSSFDKKMEFVQNFHEATFDKQKVKSLARYLEKGEADDTTLSTVTIHSSLTNIGWAGLKPEIVSQPVPSIVEYSMETVSVVYMYYVSTGTKNNKELYKIREFIRVRYANNRMYLLGYRRTMDEVFHFKLANKEKSYFKVGITNHKNIKMFTSAEQKKICFAQERVVWYYDTIKNKAVKVFGFLEEDKPDYKRSGYDQHNVQVLNMDDKGNIDFMLYGYFNRGDYEGRVGIILYKYYSDTDRIEELVYIPMSTTYQLLKEEVEEFGYLSTTGVYYFKVSDSIYAYNIASKKLKIIAEGVLQDYIILLRDSHYMVWQQETDISQSKELRVMDLEKQTFATISAGENENIKILGNSDNNIIYGFVNTKNIRISRQGEKIIPFYKIVIASGNGKVLKTYHKDRIYVTNVKVNNDVIQLERVRKQGSSFKSIKNDSIINNQYSVKKTTEIEVEMSEKALKEYYIKMPENTVIGKIDSVQSTKSTVIKESTILQLEEKMFANKKYYVYGYGLITGSYNQIAQAVMKADEAMGVVTGSNHKILWERGGKYLRNKISNYKKISVTHDIDSVGACVSMVLDRKGIHVDPVAISASSISIYQQLVSNTDGRNTFNLTGCTLDQVLYYVSSQEPVIGYRGKNQAVLIVGYDEYYAYYYDPQTTGVKTILLSNAEKMFKNGGNVFFVSC